MTDTPLRRTVTREPRLTKAQWREVVSAITSRATEYEQDGAGYGSTGQKSATLERAWSKLAQYRADRVI